MEMASGRSGGVQAIARAAAVLRALGPEALSLGALARATSLPRSTVQRIVEALATEGFVEVGEGGVRPGWGLRRLAAAAQSNIAALVRPGLEALFEHTRESVDLSTGHGREVAFLDRIISDQELRVVPIADRPRPLHAMANGKAILACMSDAQVVRLIGGKAARLTAATKTAMPDLLADLASVRQTGFAYDWEEHAPGVCAIGTAIMVEGLPPHAVSLAVPASRFNAGVETYQSALRECRNWMETALSRKSARNEPTFRT